MIAVIFEALPAERKWDEYLELAASLRPELAKIEGFISVERFQSMADPKKVLSLSFWEDEASISQWRNVELHREAQSQGRASVFNNYRIRIGSIVRDYGMAERMEAPKDSSIIHDKISRT
jgi:heme-degrading monooxygenase HmoA